MALNRRLFYLAAALLIFTPSVAKALETIDVDIVEIDVPDTVDPETWFEEYDSGARTVEGLDFLCVISPDECWMLLGKPVEGLDVITYELYILSTEDFNVRILTKQACYAFFSPTSEYLFVATGPSPIIFDLARNSGTVLMNIQSGLENYPVWVSEWSADGKELIVHQQKRFDDSSEPRAWKITLEAP